MIKKFIMLMLIILIVLTLSAVCHAETQSPGLWPAIESIEEKEGKYLFNINTMIYCPDGISGTLFVAAYDSSDKLVDIAVTANVTIGEYTIENNCFQKEHIGKSFDAELMCKNNEDLKIKAFLIEENTLTPMLESGYIDYFYNDGESYVDVSYVLESEHTPKEAKVYFYYYYYDGQWSRLEYSFAEQFEVGMIENENIVKFHHYIIEDSYSDSTGLHFHNDEKFIESGRNITYPYAPNHFPGIKLRWDLVNASEQIRKYYGFKTERIRIWL